MNEFNFIKHIKDRFSLHAIGDDCAVLPKDDRSDLIITADMLVENVDFRMEWTTPEYLGHKALAVSLSDIAAMGGIPRWAMLSIAVPETLWANGFLNAFYEGWHGLASIFEVELVGGDISRSENGLVIDSTIGGEVNKDKAIKRSGARPGDSIYVSGPLGTAAGGLKILESGKATAGGTLTMKQCRPLPQTRLGIRLGQYDVATSMIDLSDGLSSDLTHLCTASGTGAVIYANDIPFEGELLDFAGSAESLIELALHGGEDFELLFTSTPKRLQQAGINDVFRIGEITDNPGLIESDRNGERELLLPGGFRHF
jgi:thiamine-monophosphate kinase